MWVIGLTNVRGTIVTLIDGGIWLHGSPCDRRRGSVILVDMGARPVGVLVDEIADIRAALRDETLYEPLDLRAALASVVAVSEDE
jgi:chemotaxis signal transduction protein